MRHRTKAKCHFPSIRAKGSRHTQCVRHETAQELIAKASQGCYDGSADKADDGLTCEEDEYGDKAGAQDDAPRNVSGRVWHDRPPEIALMDVD